MSNPNRLKGHAKKVAAQITIEAAGKRRNQPHPNRVRREAIRDALRAWRGVV